MATFVNSATFLFLLATWFLAILLVILGATLIPFIPTLSFDIVATLLRIAARLLLLTLASLTT